MLRFGSYIMSGNNIIYRDGDAHKVPFFALKRVQLLFLAFLALRLPIWTEIQLFFLILLDLTTINV
jgi:hypothetical protein